jgi:serine/threonine-protein kinase RsbW
MRLVLASEPVHLEAAVLEAETFFKSHIADDDLVYNIVLLTSEVVTNGMEHGNDFDLAKKVTVEFIVDEESAQITVEDEGTGFARDRVPNPLENSHLLDDGGRGLFLLESLADEVHYELGGRRTRVVFKRTA